MDMDILYDPRDRPYYDKRGLRILHWLDDLGARPLNEVDPDAPGFLFGIARRTEDYARLISARPPVRDRPEERATLLRLWSVLDCLETANVGVPGPKTWRLSLDAPVPDDLVFPLFVRTAESSWKLGGKISKVKNQRQLEDESTALRRALGWNALILARQWLDLASCGEGRYGPIPCEVRVWIVDAAPYAWSFHYLNIVKNPKGFPPSPKDLATLRDLSARVGSAFRSRLTVADFARGKDGQWWFIEAGA